MQPAPPGRPASGVRATGNPWTARHNRHLRRPRVGMLPGYCASVSHRAGDGYAGTRSSYAPPRPGGDPGSLNRPPRDIGLHWRNSAVGEAAPGHITRLQRKIWCCLRPHRKSNCTSGRPTISGRAMMGARASDFPGQVSLRPRQRRHRHDRGGSTANPTTF